MQKNIQHKRHSEPNKQKIAFLSSFGGFKKKNYKKSTKLEESLQQRIDVVSPFIQKKESKTSYYGKKTYFNFRSHNIAVSNSFFFVDCQPHNQNFGSCTSTR